jgi:hypothetical protein
LADDFSAVYWNPAGLAWTGRGTYGLSLDGAFPRGTMRLRTGSWAGVLVSFWKVDAFVEYLTPRVPSEGPTSMPVMAFSSGTAWNFQLPGQYEEKALSIGVALSRAF